MVPILPKRTQGRSSEQADALPRATRLSSGGGGLERLTADVASLDSSGVCPGRALGPEQPSSSPKPGSKCRHFTPELSLLVALLCHLPKQSLALAPTCPCPGLWPAAFSPSLLTGLPPLSSRLPSHPSSIRSPQARGGTQVSPDLLLLLDVHATDQPAHHPRGHLPRDIQTVQEGDVLDSALCVVIHEALGNNWKRTRDQ